MSGLAARALATWFGCGFFPVGPGTVGSIAALAIAWILHTYAGAQPWHFAVLVALLAVPAAWAATEYERISGRRDPSQIVIDEVAGQWLTLAGATTLTWKSWLLAFLLFRAFDILKPPPVRQLERLPQGWGVLADDLMAGVYGALVLLSAGCFNLY